jgi:AcrR family transcriptional regulator
MVIRQRAMQAEDKQERYDAILDAAERLLLRSSDRSANMAEVADEAGLAKGTVYLYFPSKEELLLALHERNIDAFFRALIALLETAGPVTIDDVWPLTQRHMIDSPLFLHLASRCFSMLEQNVPAEAAAAFGARMSERLVRAGAGLERHFPELQPGDGVALLRHSYALILGLWQMAGSIATPYASRRVGTAIDEQSASVRNYAQDLDRGLRTLWEGMLGHDTKRAASS